MTMKELAKMAGVSISAVSRYINGGSLGKEKRERIRQVIEETGFQPDVAAKMLRTGSTDYVGLIVPDLSSESNTRFISGATATLREAGYQVLLAETMEDGKKELDSLNAFQNRQVAGIILLAGESTLMLEDRLKEISVPFVVAGQKFRHIPCVYHDDYGAAYDLTDLILSKKDRRKMIFIGCSESEIGAEANPKEGLMAAMKDHNLNPEDLHCEITKPSVDGGRAAMKKILSHKLSFDTVICSRDQIAFGVMDVLEKAGISIPKDVSLVGMGDNWAGEHIKPHLTTAHFYYKTCGEKSANLLAEMIASKEDEGPVHQITLGYTIKQRDSI